MKLKIVKKNKVLSLFDGMACGMLAMQKANILVGDYFAYEIDRYAIKTVLHNFPNIKELGNVFDEDFSKYVGVDFLIGGSPCTYWSIAQSPNKRETTASGLGWELFSQYTKALQEAKPKYFIYENNKSMAKAIYESISESFGFEPIMINSALVSAQNRQRYYWVGKRNEDGTYSKVDIEQPEDRGILLKDVLDGVVDREKSRVRTDGKTNAVTTVSKDNLIGEPVRCFTLPREDGVQTQSKPYRVYSIDGKTTTLCAEGGGMGAKTGLYAIPVEEWKELSENEMDYMVRGYADRRWNYCQRPAQDDKAKCLVANISKGVPYNICAIPVEFENGIPTKAVSCSDGKTYTVHEVKNGQITIKGKTYPIKLIDGYYIIRKLTVSECKRLQTVPDWYEFPVSDTQAYKMLGNGWSVDVISHILKCIKGDI